MHVCVWCGGGGSGVCVCVCVCVCVWFPGGVVVSMVCFHSTGWWFKSHQG